MEHVGLTVPNLKEACNFFENVLGAEVMFTGARNVRSDDSDWMRENLNVDPRAVITELCFVRMLNGTNFELFEYESPDQKVVNIKNSDVGGYHFAFYVEDIDLAVAYLKAQGLSVIGEPKTVAEGPNRGLRWCYFLTPWGLQLEVVSSPEGTDFDNRAVQDGSRRLFHPGLARETLINVP